MSAHPLAGKPAPKDLLIDVNKFEEAFYASKPDPADVNQLVSFGTSGHRGTSSNATFTEAHILVARGWERQLFEEVIFSYARAHRALLSICL